MYGKNEMIDLLNEKQIQYERVDHPAAYTMEDLESVELPYPDRNAKNVFVHDRKKKHYFLITVMGDKKVDLQQIRDRFETSRLSFAKDEDLANILGVEPGSVSPLAILNDSEKKVQYILDDEFLTGNKMIAAHPNENTVSLYLHVDDLVGLIEEAEHTVIYLEIK